MADTSAARKAIQAAYAERRNVTGGLSMAELKLQAAGGLLRDDPLPWPEDSPVWIEHAQLGIEQALAACDALRKAILAAGLEVAKLEARDA